MTDFRPANVGVLPRAAFHERERLFAALESAYPVLFEPRAAGEFAGLDGAVVVGNCPFPDQEERVPVLVAFTPEEQGSGDGETRIDFTNANELDARLRRRILREYASVAPVSVASDEVVLAAAAAGPLWVRVERPGGAVSEVSALAPSELGDAETLRERLRDGRFFALLPIVHFLRRLAAARGWTPPPLRASFLFDDPNLHWPTYGYIDFSELARRADEEGYHVAVATVPLDAWFAHPRVIRLFRARPERLSLLIHGNDHVYKELERPRTDGEARALAFQALRRVAALERRSGLCVARLMAPPHGVCSHRTARALLDVGYEGLCISRPYLDDGQAAAPPLAGWGPSDVISGGLPAIPRYGLDQPRVDILFRAFLDQPLILYGHHRDLAGGPGVLTDAREQIERLGPVQWVSPQQVARSNFAMWTRGQTIRVRLFSRHVELNVPDGVSELVFELPTAAGEGQADFVRLRASGAATSIRLGEALPWTKPGPVEILLSRGGQLAMDGRRPRGVHAWPIVRRVGVETRDRLQPALTTARAWLR